MTTISEFKGDFAFLSNFYPSTLYVDGERYKSAEHAYQALKSNDPETRRLIREAPTPGAAKKLGRAVVLREDWESVKVDTMRSLVKQKFENPFLRSALLATGGAELVEGNYWHDTCWGVCGGVGENWLGKILMEVREQCLAEELADRV